jgi:spermidine/putrescine transport system ATP-binding protein
MQSELKRLQTETGITFVFVTHDQEEALTMSDRIAVMSEGRILQLGSPSEIYHRPAVRFVADFIGETNFLDLPVAAVADGRATLTLPGGTAIEADLVEGVSPAAGETVTTVIRPEQAQLAANCTADLTGMLESVMFFGTDTHLHLRLADGQPFTLRRQNAGQTADPATGTPIGVRLAPGALRILRG